MTVIVALSLMIGLLLGLLGGGGSVLAVPMLVYLHHLDAKTAIATALLMVGVTSLIAMLGHARGGRVCWKTGLTFASAGMLGAYGGGQMAAHLPGGVLLLLFALVMLFTSFAMLHGWPGRQDEPQNRSSICPSRVPVLAILLDGILVGGLTGLVGAGGGFIIVPALNLLGRLPMHAAVGTSLLVLTLNSAAALAGYASHVALDWRLTGFLTAAAVIGSLVGTQVSRHLSGQGLRRGFGVFILLVAAFVFYRELTAALFGEILAALRTHPDFLWGLGSALGVALIYHLLVWAHAQGLKQGPAG